MRVNTEANEQVQEAIFTMKLNRLAHTSQKHVFLSRGRLGVCAIESFQKRITFFNTRNTNVIPLLNTAIIERKLSPFLCNPDSLPTKYNFFLFIVKILKESSMLQDFKVV